MPREFELGIFPAVHPIAFQLGPLTVTWFGILMAVAFLAGLWTASRRAALTGLQPDVVLDLGLWLIVGAILGARGLYVATFWREQFAHAPLTEWLKVWHGGLVFYGGLGGAVLATLLYAWRKALPIWKLADAVAPSIALGSFFGRIGCLMNGCCYGRPSTLPWAIHFPTPHGPDSGGVHPTQVYDSLANLGFYAVLAWLYRRKKFDGQVFAVYLIGYAVLRFSVEIFRGDYPANQRFLGGWATPAQMLSCLILAAGLVLLWLRAGSERRAGLANHPASPNLGTPDRHQKR